MNETMIRTYCKVIAEKGNMILFVESDEDPFMTAENLKTGEMWSCHSMDEWEMLCEMEG